VKILEFHPPLLYHCTCWANGWEGLRANLDEEMKITTSAGNRTAVVERADSRCMKMKDDGLGIFRPEYLKSA
jgi:hypothetical protein